MQDGFSLSYYIAKARNIDSKSFERKLNVAILGSFTLNGLEEIIRVKCAQKQIHCSTYVSGYNQYNQEILNASSKLYEFKPDVTFLILDTRTVLGNLFYSPYSASIAERRKFIENKSEELFTLVKAFNRSNSKLIITNFCVPTYSPYGICETKEEYGLQEMVRDLNNKLIQNTAEEPSVYVYDFNSFITKHGESNVFLARQFLLGDIKIDLDYLSRLAEDFMGYIKPILGINLKCMVFDLDNTLWGGVVGEDGFDGIKLGTTPPGNAFVEFQRYVLALHQRGVILAINSKNNPDDALKVIREHPNMILHEENFACLKINWNDKVSNMKEIAEELNIGLDSLAFFDDDPVNREYVKMSLPEITVVELPKDPSAYATILQNMNDFNVLKITEEDSKRGEMYLQQRKRKDLEKTASNLEDFLKQLDIKITIKKSNTFTIPRISQLTLKTNQFNLTTRRYQEEDIRKFSQDKNMLIGCAQVEDKFGDNGITGAFIVKKNDTEWTIDTFLLSCRVMGRDVEKAIMGYIINEAKKEKITKVVAEFISTKKNKPSEDFLASCGFQKEGENWFYFIDDTFKIPHHLTVNVE